MLFNSIDQEKEFMSKLGWTSSSQTGYPWGYSPPWRQDNVVAREFAVPLAIETVRQSFTDKTIVSLILQDLLTIPIHV